MTEPTVTSINAVTLTTRDIRQAVPFYSAVGFALENGGEDVSDVDAMYERARAQGLSKLTMPGYAHWDERYFHA